VVFFIVTGKDDKVDMIGKVCLATSCLWRTWSVAFSKHVKLSYVFSLEQVMQLFTCFFKLRDYYRCQLFKSHKNA